ncbi:MAG: hypothetical protein AVDCRST_MAG87-2087, partial [uncultured Thermomicrobiales bacterium]
DRLDPLGVAGLDVGTLAVELGGLPGVRPLVQIATGGHLIEQRQELLAGQIIELVEDTVGAAVAGNLGTVEPAPVGKPVEILGRVNGEIHVRRVKPMIGTLAERHGGREQREQEEQRKDGRQQ